MQKIKLMAKTLITFAFALALLYFSSYNSYATVESDDDMSKTISPGESATYNFTATNDNPTSVYEEYTVDAIGTPKNWSIEISDDSFRLYYTQSKDITITVNSPSDAKNNTIAQIKIIFTISPLVGGTTSAEVLTSTKIYAPEMVMPTDGGSSQKKESTENNTVLYGILAGFGIFVVSAIAIYYLNKKNYISLKNQRTVVALSITVIAIVVIASMSAIVYGGNKPTEKAPDFSLVDTEGKAFSLKDFRGSVVLLDMMATWCPSCKKLIPELKTLQSKYKELVIISIDVDPTETNEQLKKYKKEFGTTWIYALDTDEVARKYNVKSMPTVVIINPDGYITYFGEEFKTSAELSEIIDKTLKGQLGFLNIGAEQSVMAIAFLAGITAFFSPCAFPLLPGYMSYYLGRGQSQTTQPTPNYLPTEQEKQLQRKRTLRKAFIGGVVASLGIIAIYLLIGAIISLFGGEVKQYVGYIAPIVAIIIAILGFMMLTGYDTVFSKVAIALYPITNALKKPFGSLGNKVDEKEYTGLFAYGVGYGSASLGCHAPIFIAVIAMALMTGGFFSAFGAFLAYAIGMGLLMIIVTVLIGMAKGELVGKLRTWMPLIKKGSAIVLIVVGIYMTWYYMSVLSI